MEPAWLLQLYRRKPMVPWTRVETWGRPGSPGPSASRQFSPLYISELNIPRCRRCFGLAAFLAQILKEWVGHPMQRVGQSSWGLRPSP